MTWDHSRQVKCIYIMLRTFQHMTHHTETHVLSRSLVPDNSVHVALYYADQRLISTRKEHEEEGDNYR